MAKKGPKEDQKSNDPHVLIGDDVRTKIPSVVQPTDLETETMVIHHETVQQILTALGRGDVQEAKQLADAFNAKQRRTVTSEEYHSLLFHLYTNENIRFSVLVDPYEPDVMSMLILDKKQD